MGVSIFSMKSFNDSIVEGLAFSSPLYSCGTEIFEKAHLGFVVGSSDKSGDGSIFV